MCLSERLDKSRRLALLLLIPYCAFLFFYGLDDGELYRNETLRAIIAREMLRTGNWIVPTLYGEPLFTKPPGMYVAIALCSWPFGNVSEWTARLPSALAATITVFLTYWFFATQLDRRAGLLAALLLPMSVFWLERSTSAEIDMVQVAWVTAAILFFLRGMAALGESPAQFSGQFSHSSPSPGDTPAGDGRVRRDSIMAAKHAPDCYPGGEGRVAENSIPCKNSPSPPTPLPRSAGGEGRRRAAFPFGWMLAALVCVAGGTLTKWTAPAFFYVTVVSLLWWRGRLRLLWSWQHLVSAVIAAGLVLAWIGAAVAHTSWDVFCETIRREALNHLAPGHNHKGLPWLETLLHPLKILATMLPWSAVGLIALQPSFLRRWDERGRFVLQALHCWAWPNVLFWSLAGDHSIRYSAPLFPALSGLAAMVCLAWSRGRLAWKLPRLSPRTALATMLAAWMIAKVLFIEVVVPQRVAQRHTRDKAALLASLVPVDAILYLFKVKDEGIMFYFGRQVLRLGGPDDLPFSGQPLFCILTEQEWQHWPGTPSAEMVERLQDAQGDNIVLVRLY